MLVSDLRAILNNLPHDAEVSIQLPDDEPIVDFIIDAVNFIGDKDVIIFPSPRPGYVWDHSNNIINMVKE